MPPPKRPKFSRYGRIPGLHRITERRIPGPEADLERLTLYLPGGLIDRAESLARDAGAEHLQAFCEHLLSEAIRDAHADDNLAETEVRHGPFRGLDAIANDPDYLAEWSASAASSADGSARALDAPRPADHAPVADGLSDAARLVLAHAAILGDAPNGFLATLRRGEGVTPDSARDLLQALLDLEAEGRDAGRLDRRLAYALHRLAFEGQILLTDAWPGLAADAATLGVLRLVQEGVDRVLSGEDIRYYSESGPPDEPSWDAGEAR